MQFRDVPRDVPFIFAFDYPSKVYIQIKPGCIDSEIRPKTGTVCVQTSKDGKVMVYVWNRNDSEVVLCNAF